MLKIYLAAILIKFPKILLTLTGSLWAGIATDHRTAWGNTGFGCESGKVYWDGNTGWHC